MRQYFPVFHLGDVVKKLRLSKKPAWSQKRLSAETKRLGTEVSSTTIHRLERYGGNPKQETVEALAKALQTTVDKLYAPIAVTSPVLPPMETEDAEFVAFYLRLSPERRAQIRAFLLGDQPDHRKDTSRADPHAHPPGRAVDR